MSSNFEKGIYGEMQLQIAIKECCMCGDMGMEKELFKCQTCLHRLQHRYCSKLYARGELNKSICDWCLHERDNNHQNNRRSIGEAISREKPFTDVQQSAEKAKYKAGRSTRNTESVNEPSESARSNQSGNPPQPSFQGKQRVEGKYRRLKQRQRYKSLAKLLSLVLWI